MNKYLCLTAMLALACISASTAYAEEEEAVIPRSQVIAELDAARASGELNALVGEDSGSAYLAALPYASNLNREQVMAELDRARDDGEPMALLGEDSGSFLLSRRMDKGGTLYAGPNFRGNVVAHAVSPSVG
jgi:hypothetical protein